VIRSSGLQRATSPPRALRISDHGDWRAQLRAAVTSLDGLARHLDLTAAERRGIERAARQGLPLQITPYYLALCDKHDPQCPVRRQVVPHDDEASEVSGDWVDPLGEVAHEVCEGLIQRYPDRVLLLVSDQCAIYCRFCTRSRMVGAGHGPLGAEARQRGIDYIAATPAIRDVILSGGDPLTMSTERLRSLIAQLRDIEHLDTIRIATRVPVCLPMRITDELLTALRPYHPLWIMTHFNHPKELTAEAQEACTRLADAGFPVMNQSVLLAGINDRAEVLETLFRGLVRVRVRPYYLLQMDPVRGTSHLRTPLDRGIAIMEQLQGRLSGIALPKFIVDTPGGMGKVPLGPDYVVAREPGRTRLRTHRGVEVDYVDPPAVS
jgi:lysine 2,3-aminomutase